MVRKQSRRGGWFTSPTRFDISPEGFVKIGLANNNMDSGTILIVKQELVDKDLPTLSLNNVNSKIILKEKLLTVSFIPPH